MVRSNDCFIAGVTLDDIDCPVGPETTILVEPEEAFPIGPGWFVIEASEFLVYGTAPEDAASALTDLVEEIDMWQSITIRTEGDPQRFELRVSDPPVMSTVAELGGYPDTAVVENGNLHLVVHLAPTVEVRRVIDAIEGIYPQTEMLRRQQIARKDGFRDAGTGSLDELTERQRTVLEVSFHSGFFEWPREAAGKDVAESLDVAPATFSQHLRKAEKQVFGEFFE